MSVALGVQSRRQFVRYGPGAAALAAVVVDEKPADAAAQWAVRGPVRSGRRSPGRRCCYSTANAVGAGSFTWRGRHSPVAPRWGGGSHHVHGWYRWQGREGSRS
jgi:hypothetical protein